jgi:hypothetical protein
MAKGVYEQIIPGRACVSHCSLATNVAHLLLQLLRSFFVCRCLGVDGLLLGRHGSTAFRKRFQDRAMQTKRCGVVVAQCSTLIVALQLCFLQGANARGPLHCGEFTRDVWDESKQHLKHIPERCRHLQLEAKGGQIGRRVAELLSANGEQSPSRWHTAVAAHLALPAVCSGSWTHSSCRPMALRVTWVGRSSRVCRTDSPTSEASVPAPQ